MASTVLYPCLKSPRYTPLIICVCNSGLKSLYSGNKSRAVASLSAYARIKASCRVSSGLGKYSPVSPTPIVRLSLVSRYSVLLNPSNTIICSIAGVNSASGNSLLYSAKARVPTNGSWSAM